MKSFDWFGTKIKIVGSPSVGLVRRYIELTEEQAKLENNPVRAFEINQEIALLFGVPREALDDTPANKFVERLTELAGAVIGFSGGGDEGNAKGAE